MLKHYLYFISSYGGETYVSSSIRDFTDSTVTIPRYLYLRILSIPIKREKKNNMKI